MAKKDNSKDNKHFFKDFKAEIKKVIWPAPKQLINTTVAIITMIVVVAAIVFALDFAFEALSKNGFTKLQQSISSSNTSNTNSNNEASNNSTTTTESEATNSDTTESEASDSVLVTEPIEDNAQTEQSEATVETEETTESE